MAAATAAAEATKLLLEIITVTSTADPRAGDVLANLADAGDLPATAADRIDVLLDTTRDLATLLTSPPASR